MELKKTKNMNIKKVMIAGGGTLGSQIAWQTAFNGFEVVVYDAFDKGLERSKAFHQQFADLFLNTRGASKEEIEATLSRLTYTTDIADASKDADILSESVPEDPKIKSDFYTKLAKVAPEKTIFTTNSSTTLPSDYAEFTGRPEKFLALHFANGIWDANVGEVMGHPGTDMKVFDEVVEFAKAIGMVPIPIYKEQNGYVLNSLLMPFLGAAFDLWKNKISDAESIDKTWMISTGAKMGPFGFMDIVGVNTMYNIEAYWGEKLNDSVKLENARILKSEFLDKGRLGASTGKGFYEYPNPSFEAPDFLK